MNKYKIANKVQSIFTYIFLIIVAFLSLFPFYWIMVGATNTTVDIAQGKLGFGGELFHNLEKLTAVGNIKQAFINTTIITLIYCVFVLFVSSLAAYGFEKFQSKWKDRIYGVLILIMMVPFAAQMIPLFQMIAKVGLINSYFAIIIPGGASIFLIFFFRQSFKSFPTETIESARIDGASEFTIFLRIVVPPMKSVFAAGAIWAFMSQWNNYLWPLIILQSETSKTLTLFISTISSAYVIDYGQLMLAIVIATLPVIIIFLLLQKQFVEGITGSSK